MNHREVMQQALDALLSQDLAGFSVTIDALRNELAKPAAQGWYCAHCERGVDPSEVTFDQAHEACGRIITNDEPPAAKPAAVPDGWVMVPREPTPEMRAEIMSAINHEHMVKNYKAMLAAAPQPPAPVVDEGRHPLDCLHINRGSLDAAADAYEAEFDNAKCREAFDNRYHKIKAAVSYDEWQAIWFKALEHERRKTAPAVSPVDIESLRLYHELLLAVGEKYPGETRHETALRYIRQAEAPAREVDVEAVRERIESLEYAEKWLGLFFKEAWSAAQAGKIGRHRESLSTLRLELARAIGDEK